MRDPQTHALGKRLRWLLGDIDSLIIDLRRSPQDSVHKLRALQAFFCSFGDFDCRQEILRLSDPNPGFREIAQWVKALRPAAEK